MIVNESLVPNSEQFSGDPELQQVIADFMTDQGVKLDRGTEFWPAKIDRLISRIENHLGITFLQPESASETSVDNTVHVEGGNQGGQIAGGDINNTTRDPQDKADIASLIRTNESQQKTIDYLLSQLSASDQQANDQIRIEITDAVTGLSGIDSTALQIDQAEVALALGDTELAQALNKVDAEKKTAAGETQLQAAAESYRRLGALAFLNDTDAALCTFSFKSRWS